MGSIEELFATAMRLFEGGQVVEAEQICRQILAVHPNSASTWNFLGVIELKQQRFREAAERIQAAIRLQPRWADAYNNLGLVLHEQGRLEEAAALYRQALQLNPEFAEAHRNLGLTFHEAGKSADAIEHYRRAIASRPDHAAARVNLGNALKLQGKFQEAADQYEQALAVRPDFVEAVHNLASLRLAQGKYLEALLGYEQVVVLAPDFAEAHKNLSQVRLLLEDFEKGWPEYEWRWKTGELPPPRFKEPRWNGEPLAGKTILLVAEQGLGDTIQFIRYASLVASQGARILLHCQQPLVPLVRTCPSVDELFGADDLLPPFDYYIPLLSLPGIFKTDLRTIPAHVPSLFADSSLVEHWKTTLAPIRGFRIGINWRGRPGNDDFCLRDIPLDELAQLAAVENVQLISLQKEEGQDELRAAGDRVRVLDLGDKLDESSGAFMDTAAVMKNLDLVITSDTSVAHLAGALGVPVWVGLPFVPNWRWFLNRGDSPWYPTMRLFRQPRRGDWESVIAEMRTMLANRVSGRTAHAD